MCSLWSRFKLKNVILIFFLLLFYSTLHATHNQAVKLVEEAKSLIEVGDLKNAFLKLKAASKEDDLWAEPYYYLSKVHILKGDYDYALESIEKAIRLKPHETLYLKTKCEILYKKALKIDSKGEKISQLESIIKEYPRFIPPYFDLIKMYLRDQRIGKTKNIIKKISHLVSSGSVKLNNFQNIFLRIVKAYILFQEKKYIAAYKKVSDLSENLLSQDQFVLKLYKIITGSANKPLVLIRKGDAALEENDYLAAETYFKEALKFSDEKNYIEQKIHLINNIKAANQNLKKAIALLKEKKINEAEKVLDECERDILPMLENKNRYLKELQKLRLYITKYRKKKSELEAKKRELRQVLKAAKERLKNAKRYFDGGEYVKAQEEISKIDEIISKSEYKVLEKFLGTDYKNMKAKLNDIAENLKQYQDAKNLYLEGKYKKALSYLLELQKNEYLQRISEIDKLIGLCYYFSGDMDNAWEYLQKYLLNSKEEDKVALYYCGVILQTRGKLKEALTIFKRIEAENKNFKDISHRIRDIETILNAEKQKIFFTKLFAAVAAVVVLIFVIFYLKTYPKRKKAKLQKRFRDYIFAKKWDKAIKDLDQLLMMTQDKRELGQYQFYMAKALFGKGEYTKAKQFCENAMKNNYSIKELEKLYISILVKLREMTPQAIEKYQYYYKQNPHDKEVLELMAKYYMQNEVYDSEAVDILKKYHQLHPEDNVALYHLVTSYVDQNSYDQEALPYYEEGVKILKDNKRKKALYLLAKVGKEYQAWERIWKFHPEICALFSDNEEVQKILLEAAVQLGKSEELRKIYAAILQEDPENAIIRRMDKYLQERVLDI